MTQGKIGDQPKPKSDKDEPKSSDELQLGVPTPTAEDPKIGAKKQMTELAEQEAAAKKRNVTIQSEQADAILKALKDKFGEDEWYKKNPPQKNKDGSLNVSFKSEEDMVSFLKDQAKEGKSFLLLDGATNKVVAFSNGDGNIYKLGKDKEGKIEYKKHESGSLIPTQEAMKDLPDRQSFKLPTKEATKEATKEEGQKAQL